MIFLTFDSYEDEKLFYHLYDKYHKLLYKYAYDVLKDHSDTEDTLQISWTKIANNLAKINNQAERKVINFMITVTKNSAIDVYKKRSNSSISYDENMEKAENNCFEEIYMSLDIIEFKEAIKLLSAEYRDPLLLKFTYGYSMKEISEILNISETNVGTKIYRAKNIIKKIILERRKENA